MVAQPGYRFEELLNKWKFTPCNADLFEMIMYVYAYKWLLFFYQAVLRRTLYLCKLSMYREDKHFKGS